MTSRLLYFVLLCNIMIRRLRTVKQKIVRQGAGKPDSCILVQNVLPCRKTLQRSLLMKKLLLTIFCLMALAGTAYAADAAVTAMDTQCILAQDGSCTVAITAQVSFPEAAQSFSIPVPEDAAQVAVAGYDFDRKAAEGCTLLTVSGSFSGDETFTVSYTLPQTVTDTDAGQQLQLPLLCPAWECTIESYTLSVTFPAAFETMPVFTSGYYGDLIDNYMNIQIQDQCLTVSMTQTLMDHESLGLSLELPRDYCDLRFLAGQTATVDIIGFWVLAAACLLYWFFALRNRLFLPKSQPMPPEGDNAGVVPYQVCCEKPDLALLVVHWASLGYLTISRTRHGHVYLQKQIDMGNERKAYETSIFSGLFRGTDVVSTASAQYETARQNAALTAANYWDAKLFTHNRGNVLVLNGLSALAGLFASLLCFDLFVPSQSYRWFLIVVLTLLGAGASLLVQRCASSLLRRKRARDLLLAIPALVYLIVFGRLSERMGIMAANLILQIVLGLGTILGRRRTKSGQALLSQLLGLRRYLAKAPAQELQQLQQEDAGYFYRTLPYASALGVGSAFAGHFGKRRVEPCTWLTGGKTPKTAEAFYRLYERVLVQLRGEKGSPAERLLHRLNQNRRRRHKAGRSPVACAPAAASPRRPHRQSEYDFEDEP